MKPTVIAGGNSENPQSHPGGNNMNSAGNNIGPNSQPSGTANANTRQAPQYQTGFGIDPDIDDIFSDAGLRSRLNRFRDPFAFARKRCGNNDPNADPYSRYFEDDTDFFPNFGSLPGRRRTGSQGATASTANPFFEHIPSEFRHYIPDSFGFSHGRAAPPQTSPPKQHPQQYYEAYVKPSSPTYTQPPQQKPKLCDAAIQTEDFNEQGDYKDGKNLKQYGMRNTVDLGQKSPAEECRSPRSQSAPPVDATEQSSAPQAAYATASANAHAAAPPSKAEEPQQTFTQQRSQGTQPMTPPHPPQRQHVPNPQHQYQPWNSQQQEHNPQQPKHQQSPPHQQSTAQSGGGFIRTVPIFVEGRSDPVINKSAAPPPQQQQQQQQPRQKPGHPTPLNMQQTPEPSNQVPPQTPHTTECINKIQAIQRDVLDLMSKVEKFKGMRNDKEYMYLDEMLTRNLLRLDTIDTNGKDSIRLARREAIKCIQASINVLEAKAEENAKTAQQTVMDVVEQVEKAEDGTVDSINKENSEVEPEAASLPPENVPIPLPPPPEKKTVEEGKPSSEETQTQEQSQNIVTEVTVPEEIKQPEESGVQKVEITIPVNSQEENLENTTVEPVVDAAIANEEPTSVKSTEAESISLKKAEESNVSGELKPSGGAVKKKIIKKKKVVGDKKDKSKSESASPAEKVTEDLGKAAEGSEKTDKADQESGQQ